MTRMTSKGLMIGREQDIYPERFKDKENVTESKNVIEHAKKRTYTKKSVK